MSLAVGLVLLLVAWCSRTPEQAQEPTVHVAQEVEGPGGSPASGESVPPRSTAPSTTAPTAPAPVVGTPAASTTAPVPMAPVSVAGNAIAPGRTGPASADATADAGVEEEPTFPVSQDGLREAMGFKRYDLKECYAAWQQLDPKLAGQTKVRFELFRGDDGSTHLRDVALVDSSLAHTALEGCIVSVVQSLRFAPMEGESMRVTYPLAFAAR